MSPIDATPPVLTFRRAGTPTSAEDPLAGPPSQAARPLKLWELEHKYHCPIIGTCLTFAELKKIARKGGYGGCQFDEYELHVEVVGIVESRNAISKAIQKRLDEKYARWLRRFAPAKDTEQLLELWRQHLAGGEVAGALWAVMTHRAATEEARHRVYRDMHMLSHQVGAGIAADIRRLGELERENAALRHDAVRSARQYAETLAERDALIRELQAQLKAARSAAFDTEHLRQQLRAAQAGAPQREMEQRLAEQNAELRRLRGELERAARLEKSHRLLLNSHERQALELRALREERDALERLVVRPGSCAGCADADLCAGIDLTGRSVLCVGGRNAVFARYRDVVERLGGRFLLHDGGREESMARLPDLLNAADAVICAADCISHNAYYRLKRHCKQTDKPCVMLRNSGLAGFAAGLVRLAKGSTEIASRDGGSDATLTNSAIAPGIVRQ